MTAAEVYTRPDGTKVMVTATLSIDYMDLRWSISVTIKPPGKRKWLPVWSSDAHSYRVLSMAERTQYVLTKQLEHCTRDEILAAKMKVWQLIKPE